MGEELSEEFHVAMHGIESFKALEEGLLELGLVEDARWLNQTRTCAYTSSSEMLGELGAMVRRIQRSIPKEAVNSLREKFANCENTVQAAWPCFSLKED